MSSKPASGLSPQITRNREFHCKMRNRHYEKAYYHFRKIETSLPLDLSQFDEKSLNPLLREFISQLSTCLEHAESAVFYGKRHKLPGYSTDRKYGILQEEYILVHFLKELLSSAQYMIRRIETDQSMVEFSKRLESLKKNNPDTQEGFVSKVLGNLNALKQTTPLEFRRILEEISNRYRIGNNLFAMLQDLQKFR